MVVTLTAIRLKSLWKYFPLSLSAMKIVKQAKSHPGIIRMKNTGFGYDHYTLTAWESEEDLKRFAREGAHLQAMKTSGALAREIRTYTYTTTRIPDWKEAKQLLQEKGKKIRYS